MSLKPIFVIAAAFSAAIVVAVPLAPAQANGYHGGYTPPAPNCPKPGNSIYKPVTINKNISIYKPVTIDKSVSIYKPVTIDKSINIDKSVNIYKPVTIDKSINITKNIDASKNINIDKSVNITKNIDASKNISIVKNIDNSKYINIQKNITINKGGSSSAEATAMAEAFASASAQASAQANVTVYNGSYQYVNVRNNVGGDVSVDVEQTCEMQEAVVVKAVHAVCVAYGKEFGASHMDAETFINSGYEGEVLRCIPGAYLRVTIGDVVQSDQGMAGAYGNGQVIECQVGEALRHYKGGMLKCAPAQPVKDCTERTNLRKYGTGDLFFSYRTQVCLSQSTASAKSVNRRELELTGMNLQGGVGETDAGY
ncbi:MAG: hypothetical protein GC166_02295 [Alphaproteobacteria bacterium]|nr:hypothetical protein [Alphaproteobacteria bacterium]